MKTFEEVMEFTRTVSSNGAFEDDECRAYYNVLASLDPGSLIVEIGLEYGRSSSVALQLAKDIPLWYVGIDPFESASVFEKWEEMANATGAEYEQWCHRSGYMAEVWEDDPISAILIDGNHSYEGVLADCRNWLPKVVTGGYAMFHDFRRESLPDVERAVGDYFAEVGFDKWICCGFAGTLFVWRKQ